MSSWTPTSAGSTPEPWRTGHAGTNREEQGFLVAGPGRAAEVAVVSLVEAGAVRISREGVVSAVGRAQAATPLEARALRSLPRSLGDVVSATAGSGEAQALRQHLVERGLVVPTGRRTAVRRVKRLVVAAAVGFVIATFALDLPFEVAVGAVVGALLVSFALGRAARPLTGAGRTVVRKLEVGAVSPHRTALVAYYGLLGKVERRHHVWEVLGISPTAAATLRRRNRVRGSDGGASCGGGCGSCSSSSCGSSSSSSGSDSGGGSSCGGGGCGGGGGGD